MVKVYEEDPSQEGKVWQGKGEVLEPAQIILGVAIGAGCRVRAIRQTGRTPEHRPFLRRFKGDADWETLCSHRKPDREKVH
jgi:hypothetical protein